MKNALAFLLVILAGIYGLIPVFVKLGEVFDGLAKQFIGIQ